MIYVDLPFYVGFVMIGAAITMSRGPGMPWRPCGPKCCHWLLTVSHHYPVVGGFEYHPGIEKVARDLGLGSGFCWVLLSLGFLHQLQLASHDLTAIWKKGDEKQNF